LAKLTGARIQCTIKIRRQDGTYCLRTPFEATLVNQLCVREPGCGLFVFWFTCYFVLDIKARNG
jgi:hypothetical protein